MGMILPCLWALKNGAGSFGVRQKPQTAQDIQATSELRAAPAAPAMKDSVTGWFFFCHSSVPNIAIYVYFLPTIVEGVESFMVKNKMQPYYTIL